MQKCCNALIWGAKTANPEKPLKAKFWNTINTFHIACQKEVAEMKKEGQAADKATDPISISLHKKLLKWALKENNIMVWHWMQQQLNLMARSASVDPLKRTNFKLGMDSFVVKCNDSKTDKQAEQLSEKNICASPHNWTMCCWTGLEICMSLRGEIQMKGNPRLFLGSGVKFGSASRSCVKQLTTVVDNHREELVTHIAEERFNLHSLQKGAATCASSRTMMSPLVLSIAHHGEWTVGLVLDCC